MPAGFQPASVTFVSDQQGWVLGWAPCARAVCTSLVRTVDGGRSWAGIPAPADALGSGQGDPGVSFVRFADSLDGWIFGSDLWSTHDGGGHWARQTLPGGYGVASLEVSGATAYALGVQGSGQPGGGPADLFQSPVGADAWAPVPGAQLTGVHSGVLVASGTGVWAVAETAGGSAFLAKSGSGWVGRTLPCAQPTLSVTASSALDLDAVCSGGGAAGSASKQLYESSDGGQSWHPGGAAPLGGDLEGIGAPSRSVAVIGAASGASWLYATFDGGSTWATVYQDTSGRPWRDIGFTSATQGVAVEGAVIFGQSGLPPNQMLVTVDGGHTWAATRFV